MIMAPKRIKSSFLDPTSLLNRDPRYKRIKTKTRHDKLIEKAARKRKLERAALAKYLPPRHDYYRPANAGGIFEAPEPPRQHKHRHGHGYHERRQDPMISNYFRSYAHGAGREAVKAMAGGGETPTVAIDPSSDEGSEPADPRLHQLVQCAQNISNHRRDHGPVVGNIYQEAAGVHPVQPNYDNFYQQQRVAIGHRLPHEQYPAQRLPTSRLHDFSSEALTTINTVVQARRDEEKKLNALKKAHEESFALALNLPEVPKLSPIKGPLISFPGGHFYKLPTTIANSLKAGFGGNQVLDNVVVTRSIHVSGANHGHDQHRGGRSVHGGHQDHVQQSHHGYQGPQRHAQNEDAWNQPPVFLRENISSDQGRPQQVQAKVQGFPELGQLARNENKNFNHGQHNALFTPNAKNDGIDFGVFNFDPFQDFPAGNVQGYRNTFEATTTVRNATVTAEAFSRNISHNANLFQPFTTLPPKPGPVQPSPIKGPGITDEQVKPKKKAPRSGPLYAETPKKSAEHEKFVEEVVTELFDELLKVREEGFKKGIFKESVNPEKTRQAILKHAAKNGISLDRDSILKIREERKEKERLEDLEAERLKHQQQNQSNTGTSQQDAGQGFFHQNPFGTNNSGPFDFGPNPFAAQFSHDQHQPSQQPPARHEPNPNTNEYEIDPYENLTFEPIYRR